jgi:diguanylate cyclase (GGDEF)-like protein
MWKSILEGQTWYGEIRNRRKNGELFWALETISPIQDKKGKITHFVAVSEDLTKLKETQLEMERLTFYDSLTGLENRRLFRDRLEQSLQGSGRLNHSIALLYLDLDQFKRINDTLGHDAGDQLLKTIAKRLRSIVKSGDTVARLGGDEFALLLTHIKGSSDTGAIARRILEALNEPIQLANQDVIVTTSIGITLSPDDTTDPNMLMKNADLAMYRAKELGRNNYQFYTEGMNVEALGRLFLENELRNAIEKRQFILYFQPILDFKCKKMKGVEVLVRWNHPERGLISPEQFIPVAEETGLIVPLGKWIIEESCRQGVALQQCADTPLLVSVNLSTRQFNDPNLANIIEQALKNSELPPLLLELEITESMLMDKLDEAIDILNHLKSFGVSIAIDDFGTGYSSLSYLKRLPINKVKVDKSFVCDIPDNRNDMEITAAVIAMAHKLNLKVTAEGIESVEQLNFLEANHCDFGQGFYYSRPIDFETLVSRMPICLPDTHSS